MFGLIDIDTVWPWFCVIYVLIMVSVIGHALYQIYYILDAPTPEIEEMPFDSVKMLPGLRRLHEQLEDQGFIPLAVISFKTKIMSEAAYEWHYTNSESTIWVEAIQLSPEAQAMVQYTSMFEDESMLMTRFPIGQVIDTPKFQTHFAAKDLSSAYHYHVEKAKAWSRKHGEPCLVMGEDDVEAYSVIYRRAYRHVDLGRFVWGYAAQAVVALITALLMLYNSGMLNNPKVASWQSTGILFLGLTLGCVTYTIRGWILKLQMFLATPLESRKAKPKQRRAD